MGNALFDHPVGDLRLGDGVGDDAQLIVETESTHTIKAEAVTKTVTPSEEFKEAVAKSSEPFVVTLTPTAADMSGTMDKTPAEIAGAYDAGKRIIAYAPAFRFRCEMSLATIHGNSYTFDFIALGEQAGKDAMLRITSDSLNSTYYV